MSVVERERKACCVLEKEREVQTDAGEVFPIHLGTYYLEQAILDGTI